MNRQETIKILRLIKITYPAVYKNISKQEAEDMINLWQEKFEKESFDKVEEVVKELIDTSKFPPTISDVKTVFLNEQKEINDYSNANLNSCYWYEIEREWCEKNNVPYYDITKGPDYPLPPFKD